MVRVWRLQSSKSKPVNETQGKEQKMEAKIITVRDRRRRKKCRSKSSLWGTEERKKNGGRNCHCEGWKEPKIEKRNRHCRDERSQERRERGKNEELGGVEEGFSGVERERGRNEKGRKEGMKRKRKGKRKNADWEGKEGLEPESFPSPNLCPKQEKD